MALCASVGRAVTPRPLLGAFLPPDVETWMLAHVLDAALPARLEQWEQAGMDPTRLARVRQRAAAIREAGRVGMEWEAMSARGHADVVGPDMPSRSEEISVAAAAALLGVSPRQVRRLAAAGVVTARRVGATWLVDRASAEVCRRVRMEASAA